MSCRALYRVVSVECSSHHYAYDATVHAASPRPGPDVGTGHCPAATALTAFHEGEERTTRGRATRHSPIHGATSATGMADQGQWSSEGDDAFHVVRTRRSEGDERENGAYPVMRHSRGWVLARRHPDRQSASGSSAARVEELLALFHLDDLVGHCAVSLAVYCRRGFLAGGL